MMELYGTFTVPYGSIPVVRLKSVGLMVMESEPDTDAAGLLASVALIVRLEVPATSGIPLTRQLGPIKRPLGRVPEVTAQLYGPVPPLTPMVELYGTLTVPLGSAPVVRDRAEAVMVSETVPVTVSAGLELSKTLTPKVAAPAAVGVPLTRQLAPKVMPTGSDPLTNEQ
jgi:hypothetical protein